jgi:hypothetical protein
MASPPRPLNSPLLALGQNQLEVGSGGTVCFLVGFGTLDQLLRLLCLHGGLSSGGISGETLALRAPGPHDLPVSNRESRTVLDCRTIADGSRARHVATNDLGEVPGTRRPHRASKAGPMECVGLPDGHVSDHGVLTIRFPELGPTGRLATIQSATSHRSPCAISRRRG